MLGNKVDLCGVDTSKLPVLTHQEMRKLFVRIKNGESAAREEFVQGNLRLVLSASSSALIIEGNNWTTYSRSAASA